jgi:hypothetical protein
LDQTQVLLADTQEHDYSELSKHVVGLDDRSCTCGLFWEYQSPCSHAIKAVRITRIDPFSIFSRKYQLHSYRICYQTVMAPLLSDGLETDDVLPPLVIAQRGRPLKKKRNNRILTQEKSDKGSNLWCRREDRNKGRRINVQTCTGIIEMPDDNEFVSIRYGISGI